MRQNRHLIVIPLVHSRADFGSLGNRIPLDTEIEGLKTQYWNKVSDFVQSLPMDFSELRVYQDGLPNTSEEDISLILSKAQTPNYDVVRQLKDRGAHIIGTEDVNLLVKEYNLFQATQNPSIKDEDEYAEARLKYVNEAPVLSKQRISYIAQRIRDTLPEGGTGLLFIGLAHEIKNLLEKEMGVVEPEILTGLPPEALRKKSGIEGL
mgnify:CR=1 FL=1